ncbi:MAG TPA: c-type cytochrome [Candidatus Eisenbacteria bacterium]
MIRARDWMGAMAVALGLAAAPLGTATPRASAAGSGKRTATPKKPAAETMSHEDSLQADRDENSQQVLRWIAGREDLPADSVFKNIRVLHQVPAGRLVGIMNHGFAHSLGVTCNHCHIPGHWAEDDKAPKQIAREMIGMVHTINDSLLAAIPNLKSDKPIVNCTTCHRGQVKPATDF